MRVFNVLSLTSVALASVGRAQVMDAPPGQSPHLWLASASQQGEEIVVQIAKPEERAGSDFAGLAPGVGSLPATMVMKWGNLPKTTLGKTVHT
jgi:hypothetical protein